MQAMAEKNDNEDVTEEDSEYEDIGNGNCSLCSLILLFLLGLSSTAGNITL